MPIHLVDSTAELRIFRGSPDSPFLAPRGVYLSNNRLLVSDTGQNRVFIWHQLPTDSHHSPDIMLGQINEAATGRNRGHQVGGSTLQYPSGLWSDGEKLIIADAWNHRVLIWHSFPNQSGQPADVVLGQADFSGNEPNQKGVGTYPSERSLYWPYGLTSDGHRLWIADTGNRRVLFYNSLPTRSNCPADRVIGQESFEERDFDPQNAIWPYSVKLGPSGQLAITDTQYYRVLLWSHWEDAFTKPSSVIIGQPNHKANGQNQYGITPQANTLNWCYDSCFEESGIWVADTGNSRLLWFDQVPPQSNVAADGVCGPADFTTGSENENTMKGTEEALYWPFSLAVSPTHLAVADTGNHRVLLIGKVK